MLFSHFDNISFIMTYLMTSGVFREKKLIYKTYRKSVERIMEIDFNLFIWHCLLFTVLIEASRAFMLKRKSTWWNLSLLIWTWGWVRGAVRISQVTWSTTSQDDLKAIQVCMEIIITRWSVCKKKHSNRSVCMIHAALPHHPPHPTPPHC